VECAPAEGTVFFQAELAKVDTGVANASEKTAVMADIHSLHPAEDKRLAVADIVAAVAVDAAVDESPLVVLANMQDVGTLKSWSVSDHPEVHSLTAKSLSGIDLTGRPRRYRRIRHLAETRGYASYDTDHDAPPWERSASG
jgi:hypothetical protein